MKVLKILGVVFSSIGAAFLITAIILYSSTKSFSSTAESADGVVVELVRSHGSERSYYPVVQFRARDGREIVFESTVGSNPAAYDVGERVTVLYEASNPDDAKIDSAMQLYLLPMIFGIIGLSFFAVGAGLLIAHMLGVRKREQLLASGRRISTQVQSVDLNRSVRVNGRHPFCITSQWVNPDTGNVHVFRSDGVWFDPTDHLKGDTIDVLIDPVNPKRYYVDTTFLPKEA